MCEESVGGASVTGVTNKRLEGNTGAREKAECHGKT